MAFSQSNVSDVRVIGDDAELLVTWTSSSPKGTTFQVYLDRRLAWYGQARRCRVPRPNVTAGRTIWIEVGTVSPGEASRDYSNSLGGPGGGDQRVVLTWDGGTYLDSTGRDDILGFRIHASPSPGQPVDPSSHVAEVAAYPGGWISDGFGLGGFGRGGFGRASGSYRWVSEPLDSGTWQFAVVPYDAAGNARGTGPTVTVAVSGVPRPPATGPSGSRLESTYDGPASRRLTLRWLPSPS